MKSSVKRQKGTTGDALAGDFTTKTQSLVFQRKLDLIEHGD